MTATQVRTVNGVIDSDELGMTLFHEHFVIGPPGKELVATGFFDTEEVVAASCAALERVATHGVRTVIDPCPIDLGRNPELLRAIAERSGFNIVTATGLYNQRLGLPTFFKSQSTAWLTDLFVREIDHGIRDTGIRAGVIKVATSGDRIRAHEQRVLIAAAHAQQATGAPIITHTDEGRYGLEQAQILLREGADPHRIVIGHSCQIEEASTALAILETGVSLGFDRIGMEWSWPDARRLALLQAVVAHGFAANVLLSQDYVLRSGWNSRVDFVPPEHGARREASFSHLFESFIPAAQSAGIEAEQLRQMVTGNVRRLFEGTASA